MKKNENNEFDLENLKSQIYFILPSLIAISNFTTVLKEVRNEIKEDDKKKSSKPSQ